MRKILIRLFIFACLIGLSVSIGHAATSSVLVASDKWESGDDVLVQSEIDVESEKQASPVDADEVAVKFKPDTSSTTINRLISEAGTQLIKKNESAGIYRLRITSGQSTDSVIDFFHNTGKTVYAEPVYYYRSRFVPNDPKYPRQWNLDNPLMDGIRMQAAWDVTRGRPETVIAIVDTGIAYESYYDQTHYYYWAPDLARTHFVPGYDFVNNDTHPNDDNWHGTMLAGIIAQTTDNGLGTAGICPDCSLMPVKVLDQNGYGNSFAIAEGIIWAADHGADVVNLSFGGPEPSAVVKDACAYATGQGATLICAAGNRGLDRLIFPAAYDEYCIAVGATRFDETRAYYSDYGPSLDVMAPGGDTRIDQNRDRLGDGILAMTFGPQGYNDWIYLYAIGTSMATAHVSGVAGLIISAGAASTPAEVREVLQETAEDRGPIGFDDEHGWGLVDAYAAVSYDKFVSSEVSGSQEPAAESSTPIPSSESDTSGTATVIDTESEEGGGTESITTTDTTQTTQAASDLAFEPVSGQENIVNMRGYEMRITDNGFEYLQKPDIIDECDCVYDYKDFPVSIAYRLADLVVVGEAVYPRPAAQMIPLEGENLFMFEMPFRFDIDKIYKGDPSLRSIEVRFQRTCLDSKPGHDYDECVWIKGCKPHFQRYEKYIVYFQKDESGFYADECTRYYRIDRAQEELAILESYLQ